MRIAQLTDTHIVAPGDVCHGVDTGAYLSAAIAAVNALEPKVDHTIVTGDLCDRGRPAEYAHFARRAADLAMPWSVIPGNHDDPVALRAALPTASVGAPNAGRMRQTFEAGGGRVVGLDVNRSGLSPGARLDSGDLAWLDATLAASPAPTLLAVHQPPFSSGLWYLDLFGFGGARRLRELLERHPHVGRVVCGHIHCVRTARWRHALAFSAPSSAPQFVPILHELDVLMQEPGFAVHDHARETGWTTTVYRRAAAEFAPVRRFADAV